MMCVCLCVCVRARACVNGCLCTCILYASAPIYVCVNECMYVYMQAFEASIIVHFAWCPIIDVCLLHVSIGTVCTSVKILWYFNTVIFFHTCTCCSQICSMHAYIRMYHKNMLFKDTYRHRYIHEHTYTCTHIHKLHTDARKNVFALNSSIYS